MKLMWTGTDSLMLVDVSRRKLTKKIIWILFRGIIKFLDKFYVQGHYCDSEHVADNVRKFGVTKKVSVLKDRLNHYEKYPKIEHDEFNVIYYLPTKAQTDKFWAWIYGYDTFKEIVKRMPHVNFVILDGSMAMEEVYGLADFLLRCNNHDGSSRMVQECKIQEIPYYHSVTNPSVEEAIKSIEDAYSKKNSKV